MLDAKKIRKLILEASYEAHACHIGSALSCVEILIEIFNKKKENDLFIFSKASGVAAYYAVLSELGVIPSDKVAFYLKNYPLVSKEVPGVIWSGGSLGHGLPVAVGLAYVDRTRDVYVLMSDGELQSGTTWESALFAAQHKLNNLKVFVDYNEIQACGKIEEISDLNKSVRTDNYGRRGYIEDKFSVFGWAIMNFEKTSSWHGLCCEHFENFGSGPVFKCSCLSGRKPQIWIHHTKKAKGWPEMEGKVESHYCNITKEQLDGLA